jgi:hypothetical protein
MKAISYFHLSKKNKKYPAQIVEVANGAQFQALQLLKEEKAKGVASPSEPTPEERALHELTHIPFRSWYRLCS